MRRSPQTTTVCGEAMERKTFYAQVRKKFFPSGLMQAQVDNIEVILDYWETLNVGDARWLAYIFATFYHETGGEMLSTTEEKGKGRRHTYGQVDPETGKAYYGRGPSQLTHRRNYKLFGDRLGLDLERKPELALEPYPAARILIDGMVYGLFTGKSLADYFPLGGESDWVEARRIVNGTDRAKLIANYALMFYAAIKAVDENWAETIPIPKPDPVMPVLEPSAVVAVPSSAPRERWWLRMLTSKIVWAQVVGLLAGGGIIHGLDLTPEQQAAVVEIIGLVVSGSTLVLRTFFNK